MTLTKQGVRVWTGIELVSDVVRWRDRIHTVGANELFGFHKRRGISRVAERLSVSTERLQGFSYDIACRTEHTSTVFMRAGITMSR